MGFLLWVNKGPHLAMLYLCGRVNFGGARWGWLGE